MRLKNPASRMMKKLHNRTSRTRTSLRLTWLSMVLLGVLFLPVGVQAIGLADLTITPTRWVEPVETETATPAATNTSAPTPVPTPTAASQDVEVPWYSTPATSTDLATDQSLAILAGRLIFHGLVDASSFCNGSSGLLSNGYASVCGEQAAHNAVINWQNQYDQAIFDAAAHYEVPPYLLKNLIAQESQFWPARHLTIYKYYEYGLGHITQMGADTLLRWNDAYSRSFCREVFTPETCKAAYAWMPVVQREMLRGSVLQTLDGNCENCPAGIDLGHTYASVPAIAAALKANYNHVEWVLGGITTGDPTRTFDASFMWRLTLAGYNAGPGCITTAIHQTNNLGVKLTWKNISAQFDKGCAGAVEYVEKVTSTPRRADSQMLVYALADNSPASRMVFANLGILAPTETPIPVSVTATVTPTFTPELVSQTPTETPTPTASSDTDFTPTALTLEATPTGTPATATPTLSGSITPEITPSSLTPEATVTGTLPAETSTPEVSFTPEFTPTAENAEAQLQPPHVKNQLLVRIDPQNRGAALQTFLELGLSLPSDSENIETLDTLVVDVESEKLDSTLQALKASPGIEFAEPNYLAQLASLPNDPFFPQQQTALTAMQVPETWDALHSIPEVLVAVLDTGVDANHPDLVDRMWVNGGEMGLDATGYDKRSNGTDDDDNGYVDDWQGWNTVDGNNQTFDTQGHGTHLAGIIGASSNNSIGVAGIAPNALILPIKVLDNTGYGTYAQVADGIVYATNMGARIINLGFGGTGSSELLQNAVDYAVSHGVLVVAAAGNGGTSTPYYPAAYPGVIAVSALGDNLSWVPFSSTGDHISLSAPGVGIYSTMRGSGYASLSGSSQASANVSGVAALLASQPGFADVDSLRSALLGSALDLGVSGRDPYFGYGSIRALDALSYLGPILPTPTPWAVPTSNSDGISAQSVAYLWAGRSSPSVFAVNTNLPGSIDDTAQDGTFNGTITSSSVPSAFGGYGASGRNWTFDQFGASGFTTFTSARLDIRLRITGWLNDIYYIQIYNTSCENNWCTLQPPLDSPPSTLTTLSYDVSRWLTPSNLGTAKIRIAGSNLPVGNVIEPVTIEVDGVRLYVTDAGDPPSPTPALSPTPDFVPMPTLATRAPIATPRADEPHSNFNGSTGDCATCHRSHSALSPMSLISQDTQKNLCLSCHSYVGPGTNIQASLIANIGNSFYSHPVSAAPNLHNANENSGSNFGGIFRHVECTDCHAPHSSAHAQVPNPAPAIQQEMYGATGVEPVYSAAGAPSGFSSIFKADREYQVCFKCHSSFTTLPTYAPDGLSKISNTSLPQIPDSRDLAQEFNPYQASFHPVTAQGRNRNIPSGSFVAGWSVDSLVTCTNCHTNGIGPHGSTNLHLLANAAVTGDPVCFNCHQKNTYSTGTNAYSTTHFKKNAKNLHATHDSNSVACYTCHDTHGSEQAHLINFDVPVALPGYDPDGTLLFDGSGNPYTSQSAWKVDPATGIGTCYVACHFADPKHQYTP